MNHSLSVYTAIYLAILFVTVSIYGGQINSARGMLFSCLSHRRFSA